MVKHNKNFKSKKKQSLKKKALRKTKRKGGKKSKKGGVFEGRLCQSMSGLNPNVKAALNNILVAYSGAMQNYNNEHITFGMDGNVVIKENVLSSQSTKRISSNNSGNIVSNMSGIFNAFAGGKAFNFAKTAKRLEAPNKPTIERAYDVAVEYLLNTSEDNFRFCYNIACAPKKFSFSVLKEKRQYYDCRSNRKSISLTIDGVLYEYLNKKFDKLLIKIRNYNPDTNTVLTNKQIEDTVNANEKADIEKEISRKENDRIEKNNKIMENIDSALLEGNIREYENGINELACTKELNIIKTVEENYGLDKNEVSNNGWNLYYQYEDLNTGNVKTFLYRPPKRTMSRGKKPDYTHFNGHLREVITRNIVNAVGHQLLNEQNYQFIRYGIKRPPNEKIIITREIFSIFGVERDSCKY